MTLTFLFEHTFFFEQLFESTFYDLKASFYDLKTSHYDTMKMEDKSRNIKMHAFKLRPGFVLSTVQDLVFKTCGCGFYGGKMIGKKKIK